MLDLGFRTSLYQRHAGTRALNGKRIVIEKGKYFLHYYSSK